MCIKLFINAPKGLHFSVCSRMLLHCFLTVAPFICLHIKYATVHGKRAHLPYFLIPNECAEPALYNGPSSIPIMHSVHSEAHKVSNYANYATTQAFPIQTHTYANVCERAASC